MECGEVKMSPLAERAATLWGPTLTEAEWLTATDPQAMLAFIHGRASERKLRRYCVEAVRPFADLFFTRQAGPHSR